MPPGQLGRIALDVYRGSANIVYALIEAEAASGRRRRRRTGRAGARRRPRVAARRRGRWRRRGRRGPAAAVGGGRARRRRRRRRQPSGLYRSDDGGATWRRVSTANPRPMYFSQVRIDPNNPDRVYMGGVGLQMTNDGGSRWPPTRRSSIHDDIHAIWINPNNSNHVLIGGDGGVAVSYDMSSTWISIPTCRSALFYHVSYDMETPFNVCGGMQDNYNWCGPSATRFARGINNSDWFQVQGGDGFVVAHRSARLAHRLQRVAGRQHPAQEQGHRRGREHPADVANVVAGAGRRRAAVPVQLGHADDLLAARSRRAARRGEQRLHARTIAAIRGRRSALT